MDLHLALTSSLLPILYSAYRWATTTKCCPTATINNRSYPDHNFFWKEQSFKSWQGANFLGNDTDCIEKKKN